MGDSVLKNIYIADVLLGSLVIINMSGMGNLGQWLILRTKVPCLRIKAMQGKFPQCPPPLLALNSLKKISNRNTKKDEGNNRLRLT